MSGRPDKDVGDMMNITSAANQKIKQIAKLKQRKAREQEGLTVVDGLREVMRAHEAGVVKEVYICREMLTQFCGEVNAGETAAQGADLYFVSDAVFQKISFGDRNEGIVAVVQTKELPLDASRLPDNPLVVVLEGVEKPGNLGAVLRACDGAGVDAVIAADARTDFFNPNVIRASTGVVFSMTMMQGTSEDVQKFLKSRNIRIVAAAPSGKKNYCSVDMTGPTACVLGTEDKGLSDFWLNTADELVSIPMRGKADSLNVSAAAALLVYEALRQRIERL